MAEMFPVKRFTTAGATKAEREQLKREFERSDLGMQQSMVVHFKGQPTSGLREYLENLRNLGHFTEASETAPEADSDDFDDDVQNTSSQTPETESDSESTQDEASEPTGE